MEAMIAQGGSAALSAKDLLFLAQNPDKLKDVAAKVDAWHAAMAEKAAAVGALKADADQRIALAGKAEEIESLHAKAKAAADDAEAVINAAKEQAAAIISAANDHAERAKAEGESAAAALNAKAQDALGEAHNLLASAKDEQAKVHARGQEVMDREAKVAEREAAAEKKAADALALYEKLKAKLELLRAD